MAFSLTERAQQWSSQEILEPNLVFYIPRIDMTFAVESLQQMAVYGQDGLYYGKPGLVYGGLVPVPNQSDYVSISGTSDTISQQLDPDKAEASSTSSLNVRLIDPNNEVSALISFQKTGVDLLYEKAVISIGGRTTVYPDDYIDVFVGRITAITPGNGFIDFTVSHPDDKKRSEVFTRGETILSQDLDFDSATIQGLFYQKRSDIPGNISVQYVTGASGDVAIITVIGNLIQVQIDAAATKQRTIKKFIEDHVDARQLVSIKITGNADAVATVQASTPLNSDTEIFVDEPELFFLPVAPLFRTYCKIGEEIIEYTGVDLVAKKLTGCVRQSLGSFGFSFEQGESVSSFYKLGDNTSASNAIDLALYLLLSGGEEFYVVDQSVSKIGTDGFGNPVSNSVYFANIKIDKEFGVTAGDFLTVSVASNGANNFGDRLILGVVTDQLGSYVIVDGAALVIEDPTTAICSFKSQFAILPDGAGCFPDEVDIERFLEIKATFASSIANYEYYLKESIVVKDFIANSLFLPSAIRSIPRKGKVSCAFASPPLYSADTKTLSLDTVKSPSNIRMNRSVQKNFYNAIVWKYNEDSVLDRPLSGRVDFSARSQNRISANTKALKIEAPGLRPSLTTDLLLELNTSRILSRFQYGAESLSVDVPFKVGWAVEVGDSVVLDGATLNLVDITRGDRDFDPRIFEITNKSLNWKTGAVRLDATDLGTGLDFKFGVWSPSSLVDSGSTVDAIVVKDSFGTVFPKKESDKWADYIGKPVIVRSPDWVTIYETTFIGIDAVNPYLFTVSPSLPTAPLTDWVFEIGDYDRSNGDAFLKNAHLFWDPFATVVTGVSQTEFTVSAPDADKFFVGSLVSLHDSTYTISNGIQAVEVLSVSGTTITVADLGFVPSSGMLIEYIGFKTDESKAYAWA